MQDQGSICRPQDAIGAGDGVEHILRPLLAGVVNEQQGDAALVRDRLQLGDGIVIRGVAAVRRPSPDALECVNDDQHRFRVLKQEAFQLLQQIFFQRVRQNGQHQIRTVPFCHLCQTLL